MQRWIVVGVVAVVLCTLLATPVWASTHPQTPEPPPGDEGDGEESGGVLTIFKNFLFKMVFPIDSMTAALKITIERILRGVVEDAASPFTSVIKMLVFGDTASGPGPEMYGPAWVVFRNVSFALWPLTLALIVVAASRGGVVGPVGFADLKEGLIEWVSAAVLMVASAYLVKLGLQIAAGISTLILTQVWGTVTAGKLVGVFFSTALIAKLFEAVPGAALFFVLFILILGFSLCTALIFSYTARYAMLFVLIAIAPLIITVGVLKELRWLFWLWLKGIVLMLLLGPANALLLKLAGVAALSGLSGHNGVFGGLVKLLTTAAVLSVLLTIDYSVIKGVFGAIGEVVNKSKDAAVGIVAGVVALGGIVASGGLAALGLGAAGAVGAGGGAAAAAGGTGAAGGAGGGAAAAAGGTGAAGGGAAAAAGGTGAAGGAGGGTGAAGETGGASGAAATRNALNNSNFLRTMSSALKTAGQSGMFSRNPVVRAAAGAARGVGSTLSDRGRRIEQGQGEEQRALELDKSRKEAQVSAAHRGWAGLLDANGMSPNDGDFGEMTRSLSRLSDEYGGQAVREAAPDVAQGMVSAQQYGGISMADQARANGFSSPADYLGSQVEGRIQARGGGRPQTSPVFPASGRPASPGAWGSGPGPYDYQVGGDLAAAIGRRGAEPIDAYARLVHAARNPALGAGERAVDQLRQAAGSAWEVGAGDYPNSDPNLTWPYFGQKATEVTQSLGLASDQLPSAWLREQEFLRQYGEK